MSVFVLCVDSGPAPDPERRLRWALKDMLRRHGLRCVRAEPAATPKDASVSVVISLGGVPPFSALLADLDQVRCGLQSGDIASAAGALLALERAVQRFEALARREADDGH